MPLPRRLARLGAALAPLVAVLTLPGDAAGAAAPRAAAIARPPAATSWRPPVPGPVVAPFTFDRAAPFAGGVRRGADLRARPGEAVRAACSGRVAFAGATPRGRGVTVRCRGELAATHLGLGRLAVRTGEAVRRGAWLGAAAGRRVRWGARRVGDRFGWIDPQRLAAAPAAPPPLAPRLVARPGDRRRRPAMAPRALPRPLARPAGAPATGPAAPALAWLALALVAAGLPAVAVRRTRRRRGAARIAIGGATRGR